MNHMLIASNCVDNSYTNVEGYKLYIALKPYFIEKRPVDLSFVGLTPPSTSFLNSSIGSLIEEFGLDCVMTTIRPVQITKSQADILRGYYDAFKNHHNS